MKIHTASVRTWSLFHFILLQIHLQTRHNLTWDFQKYILDPGPTVTSQHKCELLHCLSIFMTWSLLLFLFLQIVWYSFSYLWVFDLNYSSVHLWKMQTVKHTTISQSLQWAFTLESKIRHAYSNGAFWWRGFKTENCLLLLHYDVFWCKTSWLHYK